MNELVNIRLRPSGQIEEFLAGELELSLGDQVVIKASHGLCLGQVVCLPRCPIGQADENEPKLEKISRLATENDLTQVQVCAKIEAEAQSFCRERIQARQMDMTLVMVERLLDGSKLIFYFTAEGRVDFRALVKDLAGRFRCRVEMRQIGVRNEAKLLGGIGSCGRELCCATFMRGFTPVSVKMAKEQNLSLNPNKISGLCGRLMCCLAYEFPVYMEYKKGMPKVGKRVVTAEGEGKVIRQNVMAGKVTVMTEAGEVEFDLDGVTPIAPPPQKQKKNKGQRKQKGKQGN